MSELGSLICRSPMPSTDSDVMKLAIAAWPAALAALRAGCAGDAPRIFDGLTRWRRHRLFWFPGGARARRRASAQYLIEAAARLVLMDFVHSGVVEERIAECKGVCITVLSGCEASALGSPFRPLGVDDAAALIRSVTAQWRDEGSVTRERESLAPVAHAILVTDQEAEADSATLTKLLDSAERVSSLCAAREELRRAVGSSQAWAGSDSAIREWVLARASAVHSEAAAKSFSDAIAADRLDPSMLPMEEARSAVSAIGTRTAVSALLTTQHPETATRAAADARAGVAILTKDHTIDSRDTMVLSFAIFHHAARQLHGVNWADSYTATDARPEAAIQRLRRYAVERMIDPPPLLLIVDQLAYAVRKSGSGGIGNVTVHADGFSALAAWVHSADPHPSVGPRYRAVLREAMAGAARRGGDAEPTLPIVRL